MLWRDIKRFLVGRPLETLQLGTERLNKVVGLAVLSSDALSSVAYATEAMLLVDYTLMVAVSVAAGVDAITSAFPGLLAHPVAFGLVAIAGIALRKLRSNHA